MMALWKKAGFIKRLSVCIDAGTSLSKLGMIESFLSLCSLCSVVLGFEGVPWAAWEKDIKNLEDLAAELQLGPCHRADSVNSVTCEEL